NQIGRDRVEKLRGIKINFARNFFRQKGFYFWMKFFVFILLLTSVVAGCTTRSSANARVRAAYLAGQNAVLRQQQQFPTVKVLGPVQNPQVPWVAGLTLAQAIATANYLDPHEPKQIIITRDGESATVDPNVLLNGTDVPLEAGDVVELRP
ncbi:MAG TPA: hypothetical protein VK810_04585, partial [Dongiaceae bacterium]|nr:hypothetical protein [Dongiaceae bacterium]